MSYEFVVLVPRTKERKTPLNADDAKLGIYFLKRGYSVWKQNQSPETNTCFNRMRRHLRKQLLMEIEWRRWFPLHRVAGSILWICGTAAALSIWPALHKRHAGRIMSDFVVIAGWSMLKTRSAGSWSMQVSLEACLFPWEWSGRVGRWHWIREIFLRRCHSIRHCSVLQAPIESRILKDSGRTTRKDCVRPAHTVLRAGTPEEDMRIVFSASRRNSSRLNTSLFAFQWCCTAIDGDLHKTSSPWKRPGRLAPAEKDDKDAAGAAEQGGATSPRSGWTAWPRTARNHLRISLIPLHRLAACLPFCTAVATLVLSSDSISLLWIFCEHY